MNARCLICNRLCLPGLELCGDYLCAEALKLSQAMACAADETTRAELRRQYDGALKVIRAARSREAHKHVEKGRGWNVTVSQIQAAWEQHFGRAAEAGQWRQWIADLNRDLGEEEARKLCQAQAPTPSNPLTSAETASLTTPPDTP